MSDLQTPLEFARRADNETRAREPYSKLGKKDRKERTVWIEKIRSDPYNANLRLVYADWLEERNQKQTELVRIRACYLLVENPRGRSLDELAWAQNILKIWQAKHWRVRVGHGAGAKIASIMRARAFKSDEGKPVNEFAKKIRAERRKLRLEALEALRDEKAGPA